MSVKRYLKTKPKWLAILSGIFIAAVLLLPLNVFALDASTITFSSSAANNSTITYGTQITFTGKISPDRQGTVYIQYQKLGTDTYKTLATVSTDATGNYTYTSTATAGASYKAVWNADTTYSQASSEAITVNVQAKITLGKTTKPKYAGQVFYVTGNILPVHSGSEISVQMKKGNDWTTIAKGKTDNKGNFKIECSLLKTGKYELRVAFSDADHALTASSSFSINQKWANPWKISAGYKDYIVVNKKSFKLWYLVRGKIVATFRAGIGMPSYPTPSGDFQVIGKAVRPTWINPNAAWSKDMPKTLPWPKSPLGERGLILNAPGILIHGTSQPWLLDRPYRAVSHGCVRLKNNWVIWLYNHVPVGTPVKIYG